MRQANFKSIECPSCQMQIDLAAQEVQEIKACNWCGNRSFLHNLTTRQASFMYSIDPETLGGRLRPQFEDVA